MGADNLVQFQNGTGIVTLWPDPLLLLTTGHSYAALSVGQFIFSGRVTARRLGKLERENRAKPPIWCFISERRHHASATALRALGLKL